MAVDAVAARPVAGRARALIAAAHPGPSLVIAVMVTVLAAEAAPHGVGPLLTGPAMLAGQLSIGWSNDAFDAARDAAAARIDKPVAAGLINVRAVWLASAVALLACLIMSFAIGPITLLLTVVVIGAGWAYNAGLKSTAASGLMYLAGFGPLPAYSASTLPGHPAPTWSVTAVAALLGLGAHFANVLPDLAADRATAVRGLPQLVAERWGPRAVRAAAIVLLLAASVVVLLAARPERRWLALTGLAAAVVLAVIGARGGGKVPFVASIAIAAIDVALIAAGVVALT